MSKKRKVPDLWLAGKVTAAELYDSLEGDRENIVTLLDELREHINWLHREDAALAAKVFTRMAETAWSRAAARRGKHGNDEY